MRFEAMKNDSANSAAISKLLKEITVKFTITDMVLKYCKDTVKYSTLKNLKEYKNVYSTTNIISVSQYKYLCYRYKVGVV